MPNNINTQNFYWLPLLKEDIWDEIQNKNYQVAGENFKNALKIIPPAEWENTFWVGIIKGFPMLRANLSEKEWKDNVLPAIAQAVLETASGEALSNIYKNLDLYPESQKEFQKLIIEAAPGETEETKLNWLKTKKPPLYTLLIANLAQELGVGLTKLSDTLPPEQVNQRYKSLPQNLKNEIFSYANAEDVFRIGGSNHFSDEKISLVAMVTGRIIMGFVHPDDITKELQKAVNVDNRIAITVGQELSKKIFSRLRDDIRQVYDPITEPIGEKVVEEKTISLEAIGGEKGKEQKVKIEKVEAEKPTDLSAKAAAAETPPAKSGEPLVLFKEKTVNLPTSKQKKPFKGFDFPFSFMKSKAPSTSPTKVKIEIPDTEAISGAPPSLRLRRAREEKEKKRIVHYSELRTPLSPFGKPEKEIINFEKPALKSAPQGIETPPKDLRQTTDNLRQTTETLPQKPPKPKPQPSKTPKKPSIEGNIIDLR